MENIIEILLLGYYDDFLKKLDYKKRFELEFQAELKKNPDGIVFDFQNKELNDDFLKTIFSFVFLTTKLKMKFFIRDCKEKNANLVKLLFESYKVTNNLNKERE